MEFGRNLLKSAWAYAHASAAKTPNIQLHVSYIPFSSLRNVLYSARAIYPQIRQNLYYFFKSSLKPLRVLTPLEIRVNNQLQLNIRNISMQRPIKLLNYKNLGSYLIKQVINRGAIYKLEFLPTLTAYRIQPIFYLQLLYLYQPNPLLGQIQPKPLLVLI